MPKPRCPNLDSVTVSPPAAQGILVAWGLPTAMTRGLTKRCWEKASQVNHSTYSLQCLSCLVVATCYGFTQCIIYQLYKHILVYYSRLQRKAWWYNIVILYDSIKPTKKNRNLIEWTKHDPFFLDIIFFMHIELNRSDLLRHALGHGTEQGAQGPGGAEALEAWSWKKTSRSWPKKWM